MCMLFSQGLDVGLVLNIDHEISSDGGPVRLSVLVPAKLAYEPTVFRFGKSDCLFSGG